MAPTLRLLPEKPLEVGHNGVETRHRALAGKASRRGSPFRTSRLGFRAREPSAWHFFSREAPGAFSLSSAGDELTLAAPNKAFELGLDATIRPQARANAARGHSLWNPRANARGVQK